MASTVLYAPYVYEDGDEISCRATAPVTIGHLVMVSGDRTGGNISAAHTTAGGFTIGVSGMNAATGDLFTAYSGGIVRAVAGAAVTGGQSLMAAADGTVVPQTGTNITIGYAIESAVSGAYVGVRFTAL